MTSPYFEKTIVVVGAGRTGQALCRHFLRRGARVVLSDRRSSEKLEAAGVKWEPGVTLDLGGHDPVHFLGADLVVLSPGVPSELPVLAAARERGVTVIGEIEVAFGELRAPLVAITGTNGKSTTTTVAGDIFRAWGKRTFVGGNLGTPLIEAVEHSDWDYLVAELSSFQLETIRSFRPSYGMLLNLTADHLDRYPDLTSYLAAKLRLFENMTAAEVAILNAEDPLVGAATAQIAPRKVFFSSVRELPAGMGFADGRLVWRLDGREARFDAGELRLKGVHNLENVMAALIPPLMEGCPPEVAWQAACAFPGLPHRMVAVRVLDGVTWYNDSKGTNVGSVVKSLAGLDAPVTLIAGGKDKGGDYAPLADLVRTKVACLILIGQAASRIEAELGHLTHTLRAESLPAAVRLAHQMTPRGGAVLLSPGCSSFDMFRDYEERGEVFTQAVLDLPERGAG
jgi:UDP-N-acetylmuramoylalanine--D-glutamate ligase